MRKKFYNLGVTLLALVVRLVHVPPASHNPKRFVIIQSTGNLGDMVCTTPLFEAIKHRIPDAHITVIGTIRNQEVVEGGVVDTYLDITEPFWTLVKRIRQGRFDVGITVHFDPSHVALFFLAHVPLVSAFKITEQYRHLEPLSYRILVTKTCTVPYEPGLYIPNQFLRLLSCCGLENAVEEKKVYVTAKSREKIAEMLKTAHITESDRIVAVAPGAGSDIKRWPPEYFASLMNYIHEEYRYPFVIIGGPKDVSVVHDVIQRLAPGVRYVHPGPQSFSDLKATLQKTFLIIGNDSGAIHVGEALGIKTLTVASTTDVGEHMQESSQRRIVRGEKGPVYYQAYIVNEQSLNTELALHQMRSITVHQVTSVLTELLRD